MELDVERHIVSVVWRRNIPRKKLIISRKLGIVHCVWEKSKSEIGLKPERMSIDVYLVSLISWNVRRVPHTSLLAISSGLESLQKWRRWGDGPMVHFRKDMVLLQQCPGRKLEQLKKSETFYQIVLWIDPHQGVLRLILKGRARFPKTFLSFFVDFIIL